MYEVYLVTVENDMGDNWTHMFENEKSVINRVTNLNNMNGERIKNIWKADTFRGVMEKQTVSFEDGRLKLVKKG
jgi:hypothetical protein